MNDTQIVVKQPASTVLEVICKDMAEVHGPQHLQAVAPKAVDKPGTLVYTWKHGRSMYLSAREHLIAEEFLSSRSFASCVRKLKSEMGYELSPMTIKRWLEKPHIKEWMGEQMEERGVYAGWTRERWMLRLTKHMQGVERLKNGDLYAMKLIAEYKGWKEVADVNTNVQINFTERA